MKITDLRCGRVLEGEYVETIAGNQQATDEQLQKYLGVSPEDKQYPYLRRASRHKRIVLKRTDDPGYYVVPIDERFWKVEQ